MANVIQWTVNQFWGQLQNLAAGIRRQKAELAANRLALMALWSATQADTNAARRAENQRLLSPLISRNSALRVMVADLERRFTSAAAAGSAALQSAGYSTPGLGLAPLVVPAAAIAIVVTALAILATVAYMTEAQRRHTQTVAEVIQSNAPAAEKLALLKQIEATNRTAPQSGDLFGSLAPILGLVAVILLGPPLLKTFSPRAAA